MAVATPKVINNINYRDDDEINVYFSIKQNSDEDMVMYKTRLKKLLNNYFQEAKNYKESSIAAQRSKYIGDILKGKLGNKVNHFQNWLNSKRTYWSREMMKKYNNNDNVVERKVITVEVNIDHQERADEFEALYKKLKIENEKLRDMNKALKKGVRIEIEESKEEESKEEESKVEESKVEDPIFNVRLTNAKRMLKNQSFRDSSMNNALDNITSYIDDNDKNPELITIFENWIPTMREFSPNEDVFEEFEDRCQKRLTTFH